MAECLSWLFWQMGSAPYLGGGFGHFYAYAPEKYEYPINRFSMEVKRQLDVLNRNLSDRKYLCGDDYTIADIATYPWYGYLVLHNIYEAAEFLDVASLVVEDNPTLILGPCWALQRNPVLLYHYTATLHYAS